MGFYRDVAESVDPFGKYRHVNNVSLPIRELDNVPHVSKVLSVFLFFFFFLTLENRNEPAFKFTDSFLGQLKSVVESL